MLKHPNKCYIDEVMRSLTKRLTLFVGMIFIAGMVTLAFTPHYGCACGEIEKVNGSQLDYLPQTVAEFIFKIINAIF